MSTFLVICQKVARESKAISGVNPKAVTAQSGISLNVVNWVADSWKEIQNSRNAWLFMRKEFSKETTAGTARYKGAGWGITDFAEWIPEADAVTLYDTTVGVSGEAPIGRIPWALWRSRYGRGSQSHNKPVEYAISPAGELCLGPIPNGTYTINGEYRRSPQILVANDDVPICPERFHDVILWDAIMKMAEAEEDMPLYGRGQTRRGTVMFDLERDQLPELTNGSEPLA
ncbi:MAG: hypothetical protein GY835_11285 [bacterium]|nr:hypothetical protein [bacterium]